MFQDLKNNEKREIENLIIEIMEKNYGLLSKESADALHEIAYIYKDNGLNEDAKEYYFRCLEIKENHYGKNCI